MEYLVAIPALVLGWFLRQWTFFKPDKTSVPVAEYEVRLALTTPDGPVAKVVYTGHDLQEAKAAFKTAKGPKSSLVELYTRGNHTASRRID